MTFDEPSPANFAARLVSFVLRYTLFGGFLYASAIWVEVNFGDAWRDQAGGLLAFVSATSLMATTDNYVDEGTKRRIYSFGASVRDHGALISGLAAIMAALFVLLPATAPGLPIAGGH